MKTEFEKLGYKVQHQIDDRTYMVKHGKVTSGVVLQPGKDTVVLNGSQIDNLLKGEIPMAKAKTKSKTSTAKKATAKKAKSKAAAPKKAAPKKSTGAKNLIIETCQSVEKKNPEATPKDYVLACIKAGVNENSAKKGCYLYRIGQLAA